MEGVSVLGVRDWPEWSYQRREEGSGMEGRDWRFSH